MAPLVFRAPGPAAVCAGGRRPAREPSALRASPDLRPPRGLPARSLSALRASLGASARSPARPCRPRVSLQSGEACGCERPILVRPPARLGCLTSFGSAPRSLPVPSGALHTGAACRWMLPALALPLPIGVVAGLSGALHSGGAWGAGVWPSASSRSPVCPADVYGCRSWATRASAFAKMLVAIRLNPPVPPVRFVLVVSGG